MIVGDSTIPTFEIVDLVRTIDTMLFDRTFLHRLFSRRAVPASVGEAGYCPMCSRRLPPFAIDRNRGWGNDRDRAQLCLVDGRRRTHGGSFEGPDLIDGCRLIARNLERRGWHAWANIVQPARRGQPEKNVEALGQSLEVFRLFGPHRHSDSLGPPDAIEILVVSTGRFWTPRAS